MPLDMSIYQNLLRPPKSVAEYDAEAMQGQQNRLAIQAGQAQLQDRQRSIDDGNRLRQTVSGFGADQTANYNALLSSGNLKAAQDYQKNNADVTKTGAETTHLAGQTQKDQFGVIVQANGLVGSAASTIMQNPDYNHAVGVIGELKQKLGPELSQKLGLDTLQVPQDPAQLRAWANDHYLQSIDTDKQLADARAKSEGDANRKNQVLTTGMNNDTSVKTAGISAAASKYSADTNARTAGARLTFDKDQAKSGDDAAMDPLAVRMTAQQYLAGDSGALSNFGRGAQGASNLNAVRMEIAKQATAAGMTGADIAAKVAEFGGVKAGQRTAGTRSANIEIAANEAAELAPLAIDASRKVSRSGFLPFGKAQIMFDQNTNDPALRQFAMANTALSNAYSQVMSRGGVASVADKEHARELLSVAHDQASYEAAVAQMQQEIKAAQRAPGKVKAAISGGVSGKGESQSASASAGKPSLADIFGK